MWDLELLGCGAGNIGTILGDSMGGVLASIPPLSLKTQ